VAQSGFTPIQLFRSATAAAVPTGASLVAGELAINTADERLFFTNAGGTVQLLASSAAAAGSFVTVAATTSVTTPLVTNAGPLSLTATGANAVTVTTNGVERMRVNADGSVAIGTFATPSVLAVVGTSSVSGNVTVPAALYAGNNSFTQFPRLILDNRGSNISHSDIYTVGGVYGTGYRDIADPAFIAGVTFERTPNAGGAASQGAIVFRTDALGTLTPAGVPERMRITSEGNVGIGTTAPTAPLDVNGNIRAVNGGGFFTSGGSTISGTATIAVGGFFDLAVSSAGFVGMVSVSSVRQNYLPQNTRQIFYIASRNGVGSVSAALFTQNGSLAAAAFVVSVAGGSIRVTDTSGSTGVMEINIAFSGAYSSGT